MKSFAKNVLALVFTISCTGCLFAQGKPQVPDSDVVQKSITADGYAVGGGSTQVVFVGTPAAPNASGAAKVDAKKGGTVIEVKVQGLPQPSTLGAEFLTYVLWSVTPDGATTSLGEIRVDKNGDGPQLTSTEVRLLCGPTRRSASAYLA
jgi:hypothetical protein